MDSVVDSVGWSDFWLSDIMVTKLERVRDFDMVGTGVDVSL